MSADYTAHAARQQKAAQEAHAKWLQGLSAEQVANLKRLGVFDAPSDSHEVGGHAPGQTADMAESSMARVESDVAEEIDAKSEAGGIADEFGVSLQTAQRILAWHKGQIKGALLSREADLLSVVVGGLLATKNIKISAAALAFASNMAAVNGLGCQSEYARKLGVSRTILSRAVVAWGRQLGLHPSAHQKSEKACATYSEVGKTNHWRRTKVSASALLLKLDKIRRSKS